VASGATVMYTCQKGDIAWPDQVAGLTVTLKATTVQNGCSYVSSGVATVRVVACRYTVGTLGATSKSACTEPGFKCILVNANAVVTPISLPFPGYLYAAASTNAWVNDNGWMAIGTNPERSLGVTSVPCQDRPLPYLLQTQYLRTGPAL
jgi:hypothetical protein